MKFYSVSLLGLLALTLVLAATPVNSDKLEARNEHDFRWLSKRCCINCDNPYARCDGRSKREAVETEGEALFGNEKRCCINCMNPCANCSGKGPGGSTCHSNKRRDEGVSQWPAKRCCINCDNPYARCSVMDKREAVATLEDALFITA
ncbi:hypothetical protein BHE90_012758 [Fusarium euwallaceae]|uniref:4Fe-4S ferredoxin-type domain-containing protein n=2 Tax=Fusarium solani species complex TaxID=232080 RepID=A0A430LAX9_9HYPO|nr:hypothetical protein CEP51_004247 [Fusarium floridanum]RTE72810.1 hypothetical protein BHE90_012758 [Fusarium euwallaceae]